jgi:DNA-binding transcriptional MerR regulator
MASLVLPKAPKARRGSGRHRRYRAEDVYLMAVMFRLSDSTLPISTLNAISEQIQDWVNDPGWEAAKLGSTDRAVFLSIIFSYEEPLVDTHFDPMPGFEEDHDGPVIVLNISLIFEKIRSQEAKKDASQSK